VALLGTTEAVADGHSARVQGVVAFNGVFDFRTLNTSGATGPRHDLLGGDPRLEQEASPLQQADASAAPTLLLHGTDDQTVPFAQAEAFERRLRELGVRVELGAAPGAGHGYFNRPPHFQPTLERMTRFFLDVLHTPA
jgi:dipeptidyl aminopeptidase/acylaminoacyl peptidase